MQAAVRHLKDWYAFGEHKAIDWDAVEARVVGMAKTASETDDNELFAEACMTLVSMLPDGHVMMSFGDFQQQLDTVISARDKALGGGFGFAINEDADGNA